VHDPPRFPRKATGGRAPSMANNDRWPASVTTSSTRSQSRVAGIGPAVRLPGQPMQSAFLPHPRGTEESVR
jgi:hypothetical protein